MKNREHREREQVAGRNCSTPGQLEVCGSPVGRHGDTVKSKLGITQFERPEQLLELIQHQGTRKTIQAICMGAGQVQGDNRPAWALNALKEFTARCFFFPKSARAKSGAYQAGYIWGTVRRFLPECSQAEPALASVLDCPETQQFIHSSVNAAPLPEISDFYAGFADGLSQVDQIPVSGPALIYLIFGIGWQEVAQFNNTTDLHTWLQNTLGSNLTGHRERIAKLCQKIGFPLTHKGGRPRSKPRKSAPR